MNKLYESKLKQIGNYAFDQNKKIGQGYSSKVYLGENLLNKQIVAIKVISSQTYTSPIQRSLLKNEISILLRIGHPHLLKVFEVSQSANNTYIITEYCKGGNLEQQIKKTEFSIPTVLSILRQISLGIQALHNQKIIHRDLKPANILIHENIYKLADFGFALIEDQFESIIKRFNVGTPLYMAPEIIKNNQYSEKSDIWALGIITYQLIFNCIPPYNADIKIFHEDVIKKCQRIHFSYQTLVKQLLFGMIQVEPSSRDNINQILAYITNYRAENLSPKSQMPTLLLTQNFTQSNPSSPVSTPKQEQSIYSQRQKYHKIVQSHNKPQTFDFVKFFSPNKLEETKNQFNNGSDFNKIEDHLQLYLPTSGQNKIHENHEQIGQYSTECSFSTKNYHRNNKNNNNFKLKVQKSQLPAIVLPTYNFCVFLENIIKTTDCGTEQKLKCNFLFRKLLAIKAKQFYSFAPKSIKEQMDQWINQLNIYYDKVQNILNFTMDNTFQIFFNSMLEDEGKLLSMYLISQLSQIILKEQNSELETLIEILQENVKHQNDPFLFARKWNHKQLS